MKIYTIGWAMTSGCQEACDTCATDPWEAISWELKQCWPTARCDVTRWDGETEGISWDIGEFFEVWNPRDLGKWVFCSIMGYSGYIMVYLIFFGNPDEYWIGWTEHTLPYGSYPGVKCGFSAKCWFILILDIGTCPTTMSWDDFFSVYVLRCLSQFMTA